MTSKEFFMKKIISVVAFGIMAVSSLVSQASEKMLKQMSFGFRGSFGASVLDITDSQKHELGNELAAILSDSLGTQNASYSVDNDTAGMGGFAFWGNYSFPQVPALGIQGEIGFLFNNGTEINAESKTYVSGVGNVSLEFKDKISYTTMEVPVLVTYTVNKGGFFEFIPHGGFYLSFPIGKCKQDYNIKMTAVGKTLADEDGTDNDKIDSSVLFGMAIGSDFALNFSKTSALVFNLRYMYDFNKLKIDGDEVARRSAFLLSAGYRYTVR